MLQGLNIKDEQQEEMQIPDLALRRPVLVLLVISLLVATALLVGTMLQYSQLRKTLKSLTEASTTLATKANLGMLASANETDEVETRPRISYGRLGSRYSTTR